MQQGITAVKIGGSTLGSHDTTLEDLAQLQKQDVPLQEGGFYALRVDDALKLHSFLGNRIQAKNQDYFFTV